MASNQSEWHLKVPGSISSRSREGASKNKNIWPSAKIKEIIDTFTFLFVRYDRRRLLVPWILLPLHDDDRPRAQAKERGLSEWPLGYDKARRARSGAFLSAPLTISSIH